MKSVLRSLFYISLPITTLLTFKPVGKVKAQIVKDDTVGTQVTRDPEIKGINSDRIDGGTVRGKNLFHSFKEFNVGIDKSVYFSNPQNINNIITRVTGGNPSKILGTLGVLGNANLFLINPGGIEFGKNARLDVGGSFFASTADSLLFENNLEFSASNVAAPPLLAINTPIGLRFRDNPGDIINRSVATDLNNNNRIVGLQVQSEETLALVGGNVNFDAGNIKAPGANVEIGGLKAAGTVRIGSDRSLSYPQNVARGDVNFSNRAGVDVISGDGGSVAIDSRNFDMSDNSFIDVGIGEGLGTASSQAGDISLNATDKLTINGKNSTTDYANNSINFTRIRNVVFKNATGKAGKIKVNAGSVNVEGGPQIDPATLDPRIKGNITKDPQFSGYGAILNTEGFLFFGYGAIYSAVERTGIGKAGDIQITTDSLSLNNGAILGSANFGEGNASGVKINTGKLSLDNGAILGSANFGQGNATGIEISSDNFSLANGAKLRASTFGEGKAGGIKISTGNLSLTNKAQMRASTFAKGDAGNIIIEARDSISFDGESEALSNVEDGAVGDAGGINITTDKLSVTNGARLSASTSGQGKAGDITIDTKDSLTLADGGKITAESSATSGGNINLNIKDILLLRRNSEISTSASAVGNGGNININADFLVGFPKENSDITANAFKGAGGKIFLDADYILGIKPLSRTELEEALDTTDPNQLDPSKLPSSDITAISQNNPLLSGQVNIRNPDTDLSGDFVELPENVTDPKQQIAQNLCKKGVGSEFVQVGRGGLPTKPNQTLSSNTVRIGLVNPVYTMGNSRKKINISQVDISQAINSTPRRIVPAQGWIFNEKGEVVLTSYDPKDINVQRVPQVSARCSRH